MKKAREILNQRVKIAALGPTKAGKSTLLRLLTDMKGCFLSGVERQTSNFWKFKVST
jgi:ATPase subunit of ABC transporter with duplicated ATPase domains